MRTVLVAAVLLAGGAVPPLSAQDLTGQGRPWIAEVSHWGRWVTLAGAAGLITMAAIRHQDAQSALTELEDYCMPDVTMCVIVGGPDGNDVYLDPEAEAIYQQYAALEHSARGFLFGGQLSLLTSGAMFVVDILHRTEDFDNIPYTPLELYTTPNRIGLALYF